LRVRNSARREDDTAGAYVVLGVADPEHVLTLEYVEELILVAMDVQRRVQ
jgi:hypothetical protein